MVARYLHKVEHGSVERAVLRYISQTTWTDSANPVGPRVIETLAGRRPEWLSDSLTQTLASLYIAVSRSRSDTPPLLTVRHFATEYRRNWVGLRQLKQVITPLTEVRAWPFAYDEEDKWDSRVLLLGPHGEMVKNLVTDWMPDNGVITLKGPLEVCRRDAAAVRGRTMAQSSSASEHRGVQSSLTAGLKHLLGM
jgi:hypothetical protein